MVSILNTHINLNWLRSWKMISYANNFKKFICIMILISLYGCGVSDGTISYKFKGKLYSDSVAIGGIKISIDINNQIKNDSLLSFRDPKFVLTDSLGFYSAEIAQGCSGTTGIFGIGEKSNCDSRIKFTTVYIAVQCKNSTWKSDSIPDTKISADTTMLPNYKYDNICQGN